MKSDREKSSGDSKPEVTALNMSELQNIVERARSGHLSASDCDKLRATVETLAWMQQELADKDITLARLRSLFGLNQSEKTDKVLGGESGGGRGTDDESKGGDDRKKKAKKKPKGHGRNAADDYEGADRVSVPHATLKSGDPCPECPANKRGKVYAMGKPRTLVRVIGQAELARDRLRVGTAALQSVRQGVPRSIATRNR